MAEHFAEDESIRTAIVAHDNIYVPNWSRVAERYSPLPIAALSVIEFRAVKPAKIIEPIIPGRTDPRTTNCVLYQSHRVHDLETNWKRRIKHPNRRSESLAALLLFG